MCVNYMQISIYLKVEIHFRVKAEIKSHYKQFKELLGVK